MIPAAINIERAFDRVTALWSPKVIAELNGQYVKAAKLRGEFVWHDHAGEDELFLVVRGSLVIQFEGGAVTLGPGECCVVPRGVRHNPVADEECWVLLFEPAATRHTGDVVDERTRSVTEQLA